MSQWLSNDTHWYRLVCQGYVARTSLGVLSDLLNEQIESLNCISVWDSILA